MFFAYFKKRKIYFLKIHPKLIQFYLQFIYLIRIKKVVVLFFIFFYIFIPSYLYPPPYTIYLYLYLYSAQNEDQLRPLVAYLESPVL